MALQDRSHIFIKKIKKRIMSKIFRLFLTASFFLALTAAQAQNAPKFGHMNLGNLLEGLPETASANKVLTDKVAKISGMMDSLQLAFTQEATAFQTSYSRGEYTAVVAENLYKGLQKKEQELVALQQKSEQEVAQEREKLLGPILNKVNDAIQSVAKTNGYAMIFDTSTGATLFALESEDVTPLVKKALGVQ
jgi:outer membrane protein